MSVSSSQARVDTDRPARYGKQLVAHLGRRNGGEWDDAAERGSITLGSGTAAVSCEPGTLVLRVDGPTEALGQLEDVVGRHLVRFGARDELVARWVRADGSPGSEQRNTSGE